MSADHFYPSSRAGGPPISLRHLLEETDLDMSLVCRDRDLNSKVPYDPPFSGELRTGRHVVRYTRITSIRDALRMLSWMRARRPDVLYVNSFHSVPFTVVPLVAQWVGYLRVRKVLLSPRGEFNPRALALGSAAKSAYLRVWRKLGLHRRVVWVASSEKERAEIHEIWGSDVQVEVIPERGRLEILSEPTEGSGRDELSLAFVGRISPIKGLLEAIEGLAGVDKSVSLAVYGPIEDEAYWSRCRKAITILPACVAVTYEGELSASGVATVFRNADALLLPTHGENFGHVLGEALAMSCPVIVGLNTPWTELLHDGGGAVVDPTDIASITDAVTHFCELSAAERMRQRGHALAVVREWRSRGESAQTFDALVRSSLAEAGHPTDFGPTHPAPG